MVSDIVQAFRFCENLLYKDPLNEREYEKAYHSLVLEYSQDFIHWYGGEIEKDTTYKMFFNRLIGVLRNEDSKFSSGKYDMTIFGLISIARARALSLSMVDYDSFEKKRVEALRVLTDKKNVMRAGKCIELRFANSPSPLVLRRSFLSIFKNTQKIALVDCKLTEFPHALLVMKKLKIIDLTDNWVSKIPFQVNQLESLVSIDLTRNSFKGKRPSVLRDGIGVVFREYPVDKKRSAEEELESESKKSKR